jgi:hypothetical protein
MREHSGQTREILHGQAKADSDFLPIKQGSRIARKSLFILFLAPSGARLTKFTRADVGLALK